MVDNAIQLGYPYVVECSLFFKISIQMYFGCLCPALVILLFPVTSSLQRLTTRVDTLSKVAAERINTFGQNQKKQGFFGAKKMKIQQLKRNSLAPSGS